MKLEDMALLTCSIALESKEKTKVGYTEWALVHGSYACVYKGWNHLNPDGNIQHAEVPYLYEKEVRKEKRRLIPHLPQVEALGIVTKYPCLDCARWLVKKGIKRLVTPRKYLINPRTKEVSKWMPSQLMAEDLFWQNEIKLHFMHIEYDENGNPQFKGFENAEIYSNW